MEGTTQIPADLPILLTTSQVKELAASSVSKGAILAKVESDAGHIAYAAVHGCT